MAAVAAAAAITLREHAAEALLEVDMPQGDTPAVDMVDMHGVAMLGLEWGRLELAGTALTGPAIGTAPTMAVIGAVAITGMATIGTAIIGIMGIIIMAMMWSSSAALAFRIGGGGGLRGAGTTAIHTAIILMAMVAPTVTGTVTAVTRMVMATGIIIATETDTAPNTSLTTETPADPESPSCNSGSHAPAITTDRLTESWGRKRGGQSGHTSKTTITQVNRRLSDHADRSRACNNLSVDWPAVSQGDRGANRRSPFLLRAQGTVRAYNRLGCCAWG